MTYTARLSQRLGLLATVNPVALTTAASASYSDRIDMSTARRVLFIVSVGSNAGTAAVKIQAGSSTSTASLGDLTNALQNTSITATAGAQYEFEVTADSLSSTQRYVAALVTGTLTGTNTVTVSCIGLAGNDRYLPAPNLATVTASVST